MPIESVDDPSDPRLADYRHVTDPELLRRGEVFVAEGRLVVRTLLTRSPYRARSLLLTDSALRSLADVVEPRLPDLAVYLAPAGLVETLTGFHVHRGCLAIGERPAPVPLARLLEAVPAARRLVVLEHVGNADNVGGIVRNAAAFGVDGIAFGPGCCDPLYRKAIRVSMGAALRVPFARATGWPGDLAVLRARGFTVVVLTPRADAPDISCCAARMEAGARIALLVGSEGAGVSDAALALADVAARIPMAPDVDSLNVATATGIALHRFDAR